MKKENLILVFMCSSCGKELDKFDYELLFSNKNMKYSICIDVPICEKCIKKTNKSIDKIINKVIEEINE